MDQDAATPAADCAPVVVVADATGAVSERARGWLVEKALAAAARLEIRGEVRVRVVNDAEMAGAHMEYLEVEGTTDVLTFDMSEPGADGAPVLDVDILACLDEATRQGAARGHAPEREILLYIIHGMLHCLGYDDHDEQGYARMHAREDEVLHAIGVGATFGNGPGGEA